MRKIFWTLAALLVLLNSAFSADRGELVREYEELLTRISGNYKQALRAPDGRFGQDFQKALQRFAEVASALQSEAEPWGADFNFAQLSNEVVRLYRNTESFLRYRKDGSRSHTLQTGDFKVKSTGRNLSYSRARKEQREKTKVRPGDKLARDQKSMEQYNPLPVLKFLADDLKALQKSGFLEERADEQIPPRRRKLEECRRLVGFYRKYYASYLLNRNTDQFKKEFKRRGVLLPHSAQKVMEYYGNRNGAELSCNLSQEVGVLLRVTGFSSSDWASDRRRGREYDSAHYREEANYSFRKINIALQELGSDFAPAPGKAAARSVAGLDRKAEDVENLSASELKKRLLAARSKVLSANSSLSGVDKESLRKFRLTLTKNDLKEFEKIRKEYMNNGYDDEAASRYACTVFASRPIRDGDAAELRRTYQRVVQDALREAEKKLNK